jgi:2-oxoisovalerate ferredoxin oxidoreductase beta subunit
MAKDTFKKAEVFYERFERKTKNVPDQISTHYCPGCGHGIVHKMVAEALDDLGLADRTIFVSPVGCSVFGYYYFHTSNIQAAHGRAPAVATGAKRAHPDSIVISYQGDGDLAGIGGNEILQAANRGEGLSVFFINNAIYGMTGGQMAPTTLLGMKTTTSPYGRNTENEGFPLKVVELLATLEAPVYLERVALTDVRNINRARLAVRKAIQNQAENKGFSLVEILSPCPTGWKLNPVDSKKWIEEAMMKVYPLGATKDRSSQIEPSQAKPRSFTVDRIFENLNIEGAPGAEVTTEGLMKRPKVEANYANPRVKIAGFGGQGVLLLGVGLADCGMRSGYQVSWLPSYGPEMRGGTANCHVRISEDPIGSPVVEQADVLIAMNKPSLVKFEADLRPQGLLLYDSSLIDIAPTRKDVEVLAIPATQMADELGSTKAGNMVMLGAYVARSGLLDLDGVAAAMPHFIKAKQTIPLNEKAIRAGADYARSHPGGVR